MMMPRFYVPQPYIEKNLLRIEGDEVKHIRKALRLKKGDEIVIFNGSEKEYEGVIIGEKPSSVMVQIKNILPSKRESYLEIILAQSLIKGEKMDYLIQKATELGVRKIVPFFSSRSIPLLEKSKRLIRHHRWEKIAIEASKQSGRGKIPIVEPIQDYYEILQNIPLDCIRFLLWEKEGKRLKELLGGVKDLKKIFFIVGPEGGLTEEEVMLAKRKDFIPVNLGKRILRSETASLCFLSILQYEWGDIG